MFRLGSEVERGYVKAEPCAADDGREDSAADQVPAGWLASRPMTDGGSPDRAIR